MVAFTDAMEDIPIIIHYGGHWSGDNNYINYTVHGMLVPRNCRYHGMIGLLQDTLKISGAMPTVCVQYQIKPGYVPTTIDDEASWKFYIAIKGRNLDLDAHPLCATITNRSCNAIDAMYVDMILEPDSQYDEENNGAYNIQSVYNGSSMLKFTEDMVASTITDLDEHQAGWDCSNGMIIISDPRHSYINSRQIYQDKETLKSALVIHSIRNHYQYSIQNSCSKRYVLRCIHDQCKWKLKSSKMGANNLWKVRSFKKDHTCPLDIRMSKNRQATSTVIAGIIKSKFQNPRRSYTPNDVVDDMLKDFGMEINYSKAWRAVGKALEYVRGNPAESYGELPSYLHMVKTTNPGSHVDLKVREDNMLLYLFVALDASINGWQYCRPIVIVDGAFLKSKYRGMLMTACSQDASEKIFPLAFAVVDSKNNASWQWFFEKFKETYGTREGMCIVSDRHESIENAVNTIYPEAAHCLCMYHLSNNLISRYKHSKEIKHFFFAAAKAYTLEEFNYNMRELDKVSKRIRPYLEKVGFHKWCRFYAKHNRGTIMTSNNAESINAALNRARQLPITPMVDYLRKMIQAWTYGNRRDAQYIITKLATPHEDTLRTNYFA